MKAGKKAALGLAMCWIITAGGSRHLIAAKACDQGDASRAVERLACTGQEQLQAILDYQDPLLEKTLRRALSVAAQMSACVNSAPIPEDPSQLQDYHCLQRKLVDFYQQVSRPGTQPGELRFDDLLSRASTGIRFCMLDEGSPISRCLKLVEGALQDYRFVFESARDIQTNPRDPANLELAAAMGINREAPTPERAKLEEFVQLALENSLRLPRLLGAPIGKALGPTLCAAYQLYPERRPQTAQEYNLLIRFDNGNLASSRQLYQFMEELRDFLRPATGSFSFLALEPADWSGSPPPCGPQDWGLLFPEFKVRPGFRPPPVQETTADLTRMQTTLVRSAELAELRNHIWKPFHRYGNLLYEIGQSLRPGAQREPDTWRTRLILMERARDCFLMRDVTPGKRPLDPSELLSSLDRLLTTFGDEMLADGRLEDLTQFSKSTLEIGETFLTDPLKRHLHRQLAIAYFIAQEQKKALEHLAASDLHLEDLEKIGETYRSWGIGAPIRKDLPFRAKKP